MEIISSRESRASPEVILPMLGTILGRCLMKMAYTAKKIVTASGLVDYVVRFKLTTQLLREIETPSFDMGRFRRPFVLRLEAAPIRRRLE